MADTANRNEAVIEYMDIYTIMVAQNEFVNRSGMTQQQEGNDAYRTHFGQDFSSVSENSPYHPHVMARATLEEGGDSGRRGVGGKVAPQSTEDAEDFDRSRRADITAAVAAAHLAPKGLR